MNTPSSLHHVHWNVNSSPVYYAGMADDQALEEGLPTHGTPRGQATKMRIIAAAADLFFRQGVAGTSIPDVQVAAGVSSSQIYHHFGDKLGLVRAVAAHQIDVTLDRQRPLFDRMDSIAALEEWRDWAISLQRERECEGGCEIGSLASELNETEPTVREDLAGGYRRWQAAIRIGLETMKERGDLRSEADPEVLAMALLTALQGGLLMAQTLRDTGPLKAAMDAVIAHVRSFATASSRPRKSTARR
jgi:TetR/AcrR family transcriptional regulator, transcriptional repressor for nem operon